MDLLDYITSNYFIKLVFGLFLICILFVTDIYDNRNYDIFDSFNITDTTDIINIKNITNINNLDECNKTLDWIYFYKNTNMGLGVIVLLLFGAYNYITYDNSYLKIFMFIYLMITYTIGLLILLNSYLYNCFDLISNTSAFHFYSFIVNYILFSIFGLMCIFESTVCKKLLSCYCFVKFSPPKYESISHKLPEYNEITNENPPLYNTNNTINNNLIDV